MNDVGQQIELIRSKFNTTAPVHKLTELYDARSSVFAIYIGTNDIAYFLTDLVESSPSVQSANKPRNGNFLEVSNCVLSRLDTLHSLGMKRFVLLEDIPLQDTALYGNSAGSKTFVETMVLTDNKLRSLLSEKLSSRWKDDSTIDIFPTYDFFQSIYAHPASYGFDRVGTYDPQRDYFFDPLHPSDGANKILAKKMERFLLDGARGSQLINGTM